MYLVWKKQQMANLLAKSAPLLYLSVYCFFLPSSGQKYTLLLVHMAVVADGVKICAS